MQTLDALQQRIRNAEDLLSVVKTMRTLAAADIRHYERALISLAEYDRMVEMGLQVLLRYQPVRDAILPQPEVTRGPRLGIVIFGSDQGLCGQFNERISEFALDRLNGMHVRRQDRFVLAIGSRVTQRLQLAHQPIEASFAMPTAVKGIADAVTALLLRLDAWQTEKAIHWVVLFYNRKTSDAGYETHMDQLLPLDVARLERLRRAPWPSRRLPILLAKWEPLFAAFVRQSMLVALYRAYAHSLASENSSRLAAMQAAERSIGDHLDEFHMEYRRRRQEAITSELLDIVGGAEAVRE